MRLGVIVRDGDGVGSVVSVGKFLTASVWRAESTLLTNASFVNVAATPA